MLLSTPTGEENLTKVTSPNLLKDGKEVIVLRDYIISTSFALNLFICYATFILKALAKFIVLEKSP